MTVGITAVIVFFAFLVNAFAGFGGGLLAVPLLALLFPLRTVAPFTNLLGFTANVVLIRTYYKNIQYKVLIPLLIGNLLGSIIGIHFLLVSQNGILLKLLGIIVIISSLLLFISDRKISLKPNVIVGLVVGMVSGLGSALFALGGPPLILYLASIFKDKTLLRATSLLFFLINGAMQIILIVANGLITPQVSMLFLIGLPILFLSGWLGHTLHVKVSEQVFRRAIFALLIISGIVLLFR